MDTSIFAEKGIFFPDGSNDFQTEGTNDLYYRFEISNTGSSAEDQVICIAPGHYTTLAELNALGLPATITAILSDGDIISTVGKEVSVTGEPGSIESWKRDFLAFPTRMTGFNLEVSNTAQLSEIIKVYTDDPYQSNAVPKLQMNPATGKSNQNYNDKLVSIPLNHFQFDSKTIVIMKLKANTSLTFTFKIGARFDQAALLENEAKKAWARHGITGRVISGK